MSASLPNASRAPRAAVDRTADASADSPINRSRTEPLRHVRWVSDYAPRRIGESARRLTQLRPRSSPFLFGTLGDQSPFGFQITLNGKIENEDMLETGARFIEQLSGARETADEISIFLVVL